MTNFEERLKHLDEAGYAGLKISSEFLIDLETLGCAPTISPQRFAFLRDEIRSSICFFVGLSRSTESEFRLAFLQIFKQMQEADPVSNVDHLQYVVS